MDNNGWGSSRWVRLIPVAFITYSLAYVDRANYSIGSAAGLRQDLGITGGQDAQGEAVVPISIVALY